MVLTHCHIITANSNSSIKSPASSPWDPLEGHRCVTSFSAGRRLHRAADRGRRGAARDADAAAAGGAAGGLRDAAWTGDARRGGPRG